MKGGRGQVGFGVRRDVEAGREVKDPRLKAFFPPQASRIPPTQSAHPGPTLLLTRFADELRRSDAAR